MQSCIHGKCIMLSSTYSDFQVFLHFLSSNKLNIAIFVVVNLSIVINEIILMAFTTNLFLIGLQTHFKEFSPTQTSNLQVIPWKTNKQQNSPHNQLHWDDVKDDCDYMRHKTQLNALSTIKLNSSIQLYSIILESKQTARDARKHFVTGGNWST